VQPMIEGIESEFKKDIREKKKMRENEKLSIITLRISSLKWLLKLKKIMQKAKLVIKKL
jgi:hypothetical protein